MSWSCPQCTFSNHPDLACCEICSFNVAEHLNNTTSVPKPPQPQGGDYKGRKDEPTTSLPNASIYTNGILQLIEQTQQGWLNESGLSSVSISQKKLQKKKHPPHSYKLCFPYCGHVSQKGTYGSGWSCGYRNIQMLCCSLLQVPEYKAVMFDGSGKLPDIPTIQHWIEVAWRDGFDAEVSALVEILTYTNSMIKAC